jgi:hypothetical protein
MPRVFINNCSIEELLSVPDIGAKVADTLKFPNGQFQLKIPGPISQATLEQTKKNFFTWWGLHVGGKGVLL